MTRSTNKYNPRLCATIYCSRVTILATPSFFFESMTPLFEVLCFAHDTVPHVMSEINPNIPLYGVPLEVFTHLVKWVNLSTQARYAPIFTHSIAMPHISFPVRIFASPQSNQFTTPSSLRCAITSKSFHTHVWPARSQLIVGTDDPPSNASTRKLRGLMSSPVYLPNLTRFILNLGGDNIDIISLLPPVYANLRQVHIKVKLPVGGQVVNALANVGAPVKSAFLWAIIKQC